MLRRRYNCGMSRYAVRRLRKGSRVFSLQTMSPWSIQMECERGEIRVSGLAQSYQAQQAPDGDVDAKKAVCLLVGALRQP